MKMFSYIKSHKLIAASVVLIIAIVVSGAITYSLMNKKTVANISDVKTETKTEQLKQPEAKQVDEVATETPQHPIAPATQAPTAPAPQVKSTQEYGQMYLDLSTPQQQGCFDAIVNKWPDRFSEGVREANVKALRIYASVCSTGITSNPYRSVIESYGQNGEFFDSQAAAAGRLK